MRSSTELANKYGGIKRGINLFYLFNLYKFKYLTLFFESGLRTISMKIKVTYGWLFFEENSGSAKLIAINKMAHSPVANFSFIRMFDEI